MGEIKKLSAEGRFEANIDEVMAGKVFAFVAVVGENYPWRLGLAAANERGYYPVPEFWAHGDDMREFHDHADELNEAMGLSKDMALRIVASSMGGQRYQPRDPEHDLEPDDSCSSSEGHSWVVRDDNEEISYCEFCGADGNG